MSVLGRRESEITSRYVLRWYRVVMTATAMFFGVVMISLTASTGHLGVKVWLVMWLLGVLFITVRAPRSATVEFSEHELVIRGVFRTRRIEWGLVRDARVGSGSSAALVPWRVPCFELEDGSTVLADEVRSLRGPSVVDDVVAEARRRLQSPGDRM
jgi:hypothetical protein